MTVYDINHKKWIRISRKWYLRRNWYGSTSLVRLQKNRKVVGEIIPFMEVRYWLLVTLKKSDVNIFYRWVASASFHIYYAWTSGDKVVHWSRHGNSLFPIEISRTLSRIGVLKYERSECFKFAIRDFSSKKGIFSSFLSLALIQFCLAVVATT